MVVFAHPWARRAVCRSPTLVEPDREMENAMTWMADVKVSRDGKVTRGDRTLGWVDQYQQKSGRWRAIHDGGRQKGAFRTRKDAVTWLIES